MSDKLFGPWIRTKPKYIFDIFEDNSSVALYPFDNSLVDYGNVHHLHVHAGINQFGSGVLSTSEISSGVVLRTAPNDYLFQNNHYTVSFWIRGHSEMSTDNWPGIFAQGPDGPYGTQLIINDSLELRISYGHAVTYLTGAFIVEGEWHHVIISSDGANGADVYYDGSAIKHLDELESNTDSNNNIGCTSIKSYYNAYYDTEYMIDADIDHFRIFNRGISSEEALALYQEKKL